MIVPAAPAGFHRHRPGSALPNPSKLFRIRPAHLRFQSRETAPRTGPTATRSNGRKKPPPATRIFRTPGHPEECPAGNTGRRAPGHRENPPHTAKKRAGPRNSGSGSESAAACAAPCHIISIRSAPQQASLRGPQPSNRPERAPRRASRRAPPPRTPAPRWGRCRGCRAGRMPDRKESRA